MTTTPTDAHGDITAQRGEPARPNDESTTAKRTRQAERQASHEGQRQCSNNQGHDDGSSSSSGSVTTTEAAAAGRQRDSGRTAAGEASRMVRGSVRGAWMEQEWQRGDSRSEVRVGPSMQKERWNSTELTQQSTRNGAHQQQLWRRRQRVGSGGDEGESVVGLGLRWSNSRFMRRLVVGPAG